MNAAKNELSRLDRIDELVKAFDALDQAGVPRKLQERIRDLLDTWDDDSVHIALKGWLNGKY